MNWKFLLERKIYFDIGVKTFDTSIQWMINNYPVNFDVIYGWEASKDVPVIVPVQYQSFVFIENKFASTKESPNASNLIKFVKEHCSSEDFVVMKMDIDGGEWTLIPKLLKEGILQDYVDEFFVEIHFHHPLMSVHRWDSFPHSLEEAKELMNQLRNLGIYAHYWP